MRVPSLLGADLAIAEFVCLTVVVWTAACTHETDQQVPATAEGARQDAVESAAPSSPADPGADASSTSDEITLPCRLINASTKVGVSDVRVVASLVTYPDPPTPGERRAMQKTILIDCVSAEDGSFSFAVDLVALATSRCLITAWSDDWAGYYDFTIEEIQDKGQMHTSLDVPVYPRTGLVRLRTVDSLGEAMPGCGVLVLPAWGDWQEMHAWYSWPRIECEELVSELGLLATSGPNGEITLRRVPVNEEDPHGGYFAFAFDQRHASRKEWFEEPTFEYGEFPVIDLPVEPIASPWLEGVVLDASGGVIQGVTIDVNGAHVAEGGEAGSWRIDGAKLGAGPWTISFRASGYKELSFTLPRPEYLLLEDAKHVQLTMEKERR